MSLSKPVNCKWEYLATADICSVEKKEQALKKMRATVLKDKEMIQDTIVELDRYKRDALKTTWSKVNE